MKKWKVVSIVTLIILASVVAGFFDFPNQVNPQLAKIPGAIQVPVIPFRLGLDLQGGIHLVYQADLSTVNVGERDSAMEGLRDIIERRVNFFGVSEPLVQVEGRGNEQRLIVEVAGVIDSAQAIELIGKAPLLDFREPKENYGEILQANQQVRETGEGELQDPFQRTGLNGSLLSRADVGFEQITQDPVILLSFNSEGADLFKEITARNIGRPLAIFLDNQLLQAPIVQTEISGGQAQITGDFTIEETRRIVRDLNAGAVPVSITLLSQQTVGPALGKVSLEQSLRAGATGFLLVVAFMIQCFLHDFISGHCTAILIQDAANHILYRSGFISPILQCICSSPHKHKPRILDEFVVDGLRKHCLSFLPCKRLLQTLYEFCDLHEMKRSFYVPEHHIGFVAHSFGIHLRPLLQSPLSVIRTRNALGNFQQGS